MRRVLIGLLVLAIVAIVSPALAQEQGDTEKAETTSSASTAKPSTSGIAFRTWGVRGGFGINPDQFIVGAHFDLGEFFPRVRFIPNFELGFGDDRTIISALAPVHYLFKTDAAVQPYAGGGLGLAWIDHKDSGSDTDLGIKLIGGVEWNLKSRDRFTVELNINIGMAYDAEILVGYTF